MALQTGDILNERYRIDGLLGEGGFGAVYRASDLTFGTPCAIKENHDPNPEAQRQFQLEAQTLHTLRHPNLPLVTDYFSEGKAQFLVMDFVKGEDLAKALERSVIPLPEKKVIKWLVEIGSALSYMHNQSPPVIHRDIKPANIKITPDGKAILVDFGISKVYDPKSRTIKGARAMSPGFSPFEQYGHAPTDQRTDVYALGATAYTLLTGRVPTESISRMAGESLPAPRERNDEISKHVDSAIMRALALMPQDRYQTIDAFCNALLGTAVEISESNPDVDSSVVNLSKPIVENVPHTAVTKMIDEEALANYDRGAEQALDAVGESSEPLGTDIQSSLLQGDIAGSSLDAKRERRVKLFVVTGTFLIGIFLIYAGWISLIMPKHMTGSWTGTMQDELHPGGYSVKLILDEPQEFLEFSGEITIELPDRQDVSHQIKGTRNWLNGFKFSDRNSQYSGYVSIVGLFRNYISVGRLNGEYDPVEFYRFTNPKVPKESGVDE